MFAGVDGGLRGGEVRGVWCSDVDDVDVGVGPKICEIGDNVRNFPFRSKSGPFFRGSRTTVVSSTFSVRWKSRTMFSSIAPVPIIAQRVVDACMVVCPLSVWPVCLRGTASARSRAARHGGTVRVEPEPRRGFFRGGNVIIWVRPMFEPPRVRCTLRYV